MASVGVAAATDLAVSAGLLKSGWAKLFFSSTSGCFEEFARTFWGVYRGSFKISGLTLAQEKLSESQIRTNVSTAFFRWPREFAVARTLHPWANICVKSGLCTLVLGVLKTICETSPEASTSLVKPALDCS